ncbi:Apc13p protein-domain-containing protein [Xylaria bambusicola]|uniref:Apc13p protein-domain-containing protein n=1 Tax=Xylaria bambusicola TaxID=326684 RepID=UPI002007DB47|nr:Apc13p protein-domain-containing protein [Xylaria bambusicola]KAI0525707.1 Apc13p protein-domain-containing protein [Xylaria bambusicola]
MRIKSSITLVACLIGYLGLVLATSVNRVDSNMVSSQHTHRHLPGGSIHRREVKQHERHISQSPNGPVYRCHDPHPELFGPAPPVEDCDDVIAQFAGLKANINLNLVEGCYQITSGNCTGLVCPQRAGESSHIPGLLAAQYMASPLRDECIAKGQRGWWIDGKGLGNKDGCYTYVHMQRPRDADLFEDFCKDKLPDDEIYVPPHHQPINPEDEDDVVPDQHAAFGIQKATQRNKEPAWKDLNLAELMKKGPAPGRIGTTVSKNLYKGLPR